MTIKKNPTKKELTQSIANIEGGLKGLSNVLKMYMEFKGDFVMFQQYLSGKQKEHEEMLKQQKEEK